MKKNIFIVIIVIISFFIGFSSNKNQSSSVKTTIKKIDFSQWENLKKIDDNLIERKNALIYQYSLPDYELTNSQAADKALLIENIKTDIAISQQQRDTILKKLNY